MNRAFSTLTLRTASEEQRIVEGVATTPRSDRAADRVDPLGAVFELPLPFLLDHVHSDAVGEVEHAEITKTGIKFRARIKKIAEPGQAKDLVDRGWALIRAGLRKHVSIGFRPLEMTPLPDGGLHFRRWEWLELSACSVPMNPDAKITATRAASAKRVVHLGSDNSRGHIARLTPEAKLIGRMKADAAERAKGRADAGYKHPPVKLLSPLEIEGRRVLLEGETLLRRLRSRG